MSFLFPCAARGHGTHLAFLQLRREPLCLVVASLQLFPSCLRRFQLQTRSRKIPPPPQKKNAHTHTHTSRESDQETARYGRTFVKGKTRPLFNTGITLRLNEELGQQEMGTTPCRKQHATKPAVRSDNRRATSNRWGTMHRTEGRQNRARNIGK